MSFSLHTTTIPELHKALVAKEISVADVVRAYRDHAVAVNPHVHAYLELFDTAEMETYAQQLIDSGNATLLTGIPIAVKDNILIQGHVASASSKMLENYTASYDASIIASLKKQGAIFIGRTNMDEFAMGSSTENSAYGPTKNPLDVNRVPGGSSGGSAAALACDTALLALGTDTGGSIRQPASFCGLVGLMPTYGTVSRYGAIAMGSSLDQIGPFAKSVGDAKILWESLQAYDHHDNTSIPEHARTWIEPKSTYTIGIPRSFISGEGVSESVKKNFEFVIEKAKQAGHTIVDIDIPLIEYSLAVYYIVMPAEVSTNLARFDSVRYGLHIDGENPDDTMSKSRGAGFGPETKRRIMLGTYVLSHGYHDAYYQKSIRVRNTIKQELKKVFQHVDCIMTPTTPSGAFRFGEKTDNPVEMYLSDLFTVPANIAGVPALSIPSGYDENNMPLGIQLMGERFSEKALFDCAESLEKVIAYERIPATFS
jgi:aspartyl-tRNA(Asn)/glutamyl-tRNA(Gln) amidotransferase subunit A